MKTFLLHHARRLALLLCLLPQGAIAGEQFLELTAEIEMDTGSYWFGRDEKNLSSGAQVHSDSIFAELWKAVCVVGTNTWKMEGDFRTNAKLTRWFTGTNIHGHSVITAKTPDDAVKRLSGVSQFAMRSPRVGDEQTRVRESLDGNPARPVRVADLMEARGKICWLAFCSGSALKREGHQIPLPSDLWKQHFPASARFLDETTVFNDELGLPRRIEVFTEKGQLMFQYQVSQFTNVLGWNIPLEFYLVQYNPASWPRTNSWDLNLTAKGKVTGIRAGGTIPGAIRNTGTR